LCGAQTFGYAGRRFVARDAARGATQGLRRSLIMSSMPTQAELAKLLAEALDDFDAEPTPPASTVAPAAAQLPAPPPLAPEASLAALRTQGGPAHAQPAAASGGVAQAANLDAQADELAKMLLSGLSVGGGDKSASPEAANSIDDDEQLDRTLRNLAASAEALSNGAGSSGSTAEEEAMLKLLQQLATGLGGSGSADAGGADDGMLDLLQKLSAVVPPAEAARGGGGSSAAGPAVAGPPTRSEADSDAAMEGMLDKLVGQLLSKDVMLEPMRHLHAEFPRYIAANQSSLSAEELARYRKQEALVGDILRAYEESPEDTDRVATLMQQMQACGPPPAEIAGPVADSAGCAVM